MRKILILLLLLLSISLLFAETNDDAMKSQNISGFVDDISFLYVTPYKFDTFADNGYEGINLDYNDTSNTYSSLIKPSAIHEPGIVIANFSLLSTFIEHAKARVDVAVSLTITHDKLCHTTDHTEDGKLEYELAIGYKANGVGDDVFNFCLSTESDSNNKIVLNLNALDTGNHMVSIQDGNIYFRFANGVAPSVVGQYQSRITFVLEGR